MTIIGQSHGWAMSPSTSLNTSATAGASFSNWVSFPEWIPHPLLMPFHSSRLGSCLGISVCDSLLGRLFIDAHGPFRHSEHQRGNSFSVIRLAFCHSVNSGRVAKDMPRRALSTRSKRSCFLVRVRFTSASDPREMQFTHHHFSYDFLGNRVSKGLKSV